MIVFLELEPSDTRVEAALEDAYMATHASLYKPVMTPRGKFEGITDAMIAYGVTKGTFYNYIWKQPDNFYWIK